MMKLTRSLLLDDLSQLENSLNRLKQALNTSSPAMKDLCPASQNCLFDLVSLYLKITEVAMYLDGIRMKALISFGNERAKELEKGLACMQGN